MLVGREGRLFLAGDVNDVLRQHAGELPFEPAELNAWQVVLETRTAWLERRGSVYVFLVPPNAHSVYPEALPEGTPAGERPVEQLISHLERHSFAHLVYPLEELAAARERRDVFPRTSSHWDGAGGLVAYERLMEELPDGVAVRRLTPADVDFEASERPGDLGLKVEPVATSIQSLPVIRDARSRLVADNDVWNNGRRMEWVCDAAPPTSCLVLGDSFADALLPFLAESFGRLVFGHIFTLDHALALEESPDVVVSVLNERFLRRIPNDLAARTLRDWEREKLEQGKTMTARRALRRELFPA